MKNKICLGFMITALIIAVAGIVHTVIAYVNISKDFSTSFPPTVALFILIPYLSAAALFLVVGFILKSK